VFDKKKLYKSDALYSRISPFAYCLVAGLVQTKKNYSQRLIVRAIVLWHVEELLSERIHDEE
jgi:hypothetical protein